MSFRPYASYKDSGVEWLGKVPIYWRVEPLKRLAAVMPSNVDKKTHEGEAPVRLCNYTDVYYNETISDAASFMEASASAEQIDRFSLRSGDVILTKDSETADDIAISAYVPADLPGVVCGYHLALVRPDPSAASGAFLKRYFDSAFAKANVAVRANGLTRVGLGQYALDNLHVPTPPVAEQAAIADFLDRETAKIDALVEAQRRLIALLKEKRQAVISHAVTKGLDPSAPLKPSGIEWLGDVPAHWEVRRIKSVADMESGHTPDRKIAAYWENCTIPWVSLHDTAYLKDHDYIEETAQYVNELGVQNSSARMLPERAVVFSRDATIGRCAITCRSMAVSQHFIAWICSPALSPEFLLYTLRSMQGELERLSSGATLKTIGMPDVRALAMAVPPKEEQATLVLEVRRQTRALDNLVESAQIGMAMLRERRAALISAAVTGKIDVRGLVAEPEAAEAA